MAFSCFSIITDPSALWAPPLTSGRNFIWFYLFVFSIGIMRGGSISKSPPKLGGVPLAGRGSVKTFGITAILSLQCGAPRDPSLFQGWLLACESYCAHLM